MSTKSSYDTGSMSRSMPPGNFIQFTLFPNLPRELRLSIWEASICPRIIEIRQQPIAHQAEEDEIGDHDARSQDGVESQTSDADERVRPTDLSSNTPPNESLGSDDADFDDIDSFNPNPFYSPAPIPALLHTSKESRAFGLTYYDLSFPNGLDHPARIYLNPSLDTLYFPVYCWENNIRPFELAVPSSTKSTIRSIAIEKLLWFGYWSEGSINCQLQIDEFPNLKELLLVSREPDPRGCPCCFDIDRRSDHGKIEFVEDEMTSHNMKCTRDIQVQLENIKERDVSWSAPGVVRFLRLKRDGKFL